MRHRLDQNQQDGLFSKFFSVVFFIAIVVGLPIGLTVFFSDPLPTSQDIDTLKLVADGIEPLPAEIVIKALVILLWGLWGLFIISTVIEVTASVRKNKDRPDIIIPGAQPLVRQAVAALPLLIAFLKPTAAGAMLPETEVEQSQPLENTPRAVSQPKVVQQKPAKPAVRTVEYETVEGDSWYSIAEQFYGSGKEHNTVKTANIGKKFDGKTITSGTEFVSAGWTLEIPEKQGHRFHNITVNKGDNLWEIAATNLEKADQDTSSSEIVEDVETIVDINKIENPDLIYPDQKIDIPKYEPTSNGSPSLTPEEAEIFGETITETPETQEESDVWIEEMPETTINSETPSLTPAEAEIFEAPAESQETDNGSDTPVWLITSGAITVVGAWYLWALKNKRKHKLRHRQPDPNARHKPLQEQVQLESASVRSGANNLLVAAEQTGKAKLLEIACRGLSKADVNLDVITVVVRDNKVHFIVDPNSTVNLDNIVLPEEFERVGESKTWVFTPPEDLETYDYSLGYTPVGPSTLISLGALKNGAVTFLNLEQVGAVNIQADTKDLVESFFEEVAFELALSPLAYDLRIVLVGFGEKLGELQRVEYHSELSKELLGDLESEQKRLAHDDPITGRINYMDSSYFDPVIVMSNNPEDIEQIRKLKNTGDKGSIVTFSAGKTRKDSWRISLGDDGRTLTCPDMPPPINLSKFTRQTGTDQTNRIVLEELTNKEPEHAGALTPLTSAVSELYFLQSKHESLLKEKQHLILV